MRILVIGGAGYIGSTCLRWLLRHGHDPVAYDNLSTGNRASVPENRLIVGDVGDAVAVTEALTQTGAEAVMHFAALATVSDSIEDPQSYYHVNVLGTKTLLDAMVDQGVARIIFSSTAATYAFTDDMPLTEDSPQDPEVPYGTTKLACERMIRDYGRAYGISSVILRYFNASGADRDGAHGEDHRAESHLIPLVLLTALGQRDEIKIYGGDWPTRDGTCVRDYVHVEDLAQAHHLALEALKPGYHRAFNLGLGNGVTVKEVIDACERAAGRTIPRHVMGRRPGDPAVLVASADRICRELGWKPAHETIDQIVETAWRWHVDHPHGYAGDSSGGVHG